MNNDAQVKIAALSRELEKLIKTEQLLDAYDKFIELQKHITTLINTTNEDWKTLYYAFIKKDFETMGDIYYKHNSYQMAYKHYNLAFRVAKNMARRAKIELKDPLNTPYIQQLIKDAWNEFEKDCKRLKHKIVFLGA